MPGTCATCRSTAVKREASLTSTVKVIQAVLPSLALSVRTPV